MHDNNTPSPVTEKLLAVQYPSRQASGNRTIYEPLDLPRNDRKSSSSHVPARRAVVNPSSAKNASAPGKGNPYRQKNWHDEQTDLFSMEQATDNTPIPATSTLVRLFESQVKADDPESSLGVFPFTGTSSPAVSQKLSKRISPSRAAPNPYKQLTTIPGKNLPLNLTQCHDPPISANKSGFTLSNPAKLERPNSMKPMTGYAPVSSDFRGSQPSVGYANLSARQRSDSVNTQGRKSSDSSYSSAVDVIQQSLSTTALSRPGITTPSNMLETSPTSATHDAVRQFSTLPPRILRYHSNDEHARLGISRSRESVLVPHSVRPQLTADSLANAMVASSLASSRASSPNRSLQLPPRHRPRSSLLFHRSHSQEQVKARTPSPGISMKQTLRVHLKSDDESERRRKNGHLLKKYPNKHHEGDRKQWRDQITEHERKRYEGVWAANKGLLMSPHEPDSTFMVINLIARDIWRRSRLSDHVLKEIWDLVDIEKRGRLARDEFVVGMWLIDQRLKGRKLPTRVSDSVWSSARRLSGIKPPKIRQ